MEIVTRLTDNSEIRQLSDEGIESILVEAPDLDESRYAD